MLDLAVQTEILKQLEELPPAKQHRVLNYARSLAEPAPQGASGQQLLEFSGTMTPEEAKEFLQTIEDDCERIDMDGW